MKLKEESTKRKLEAKKTKAKQKKLEKMERLGIKEIDQKFHHLVGKYKNKLKVQGDGSCQSSSKAACLFGDPKQGPNLAMQENSYIVEHWNEYFKQYFTFPHTLQLRGGDTQTCQNEIEFLQFLILNPEASYMWADHHQL